VDKLLRGLLVIPEAEEVLELYMRRFFLGNVVAFVAGALR